VSEGECVEILYVGEKEDDMGWLFARSCQTKGEGWLPQDNLQMEETPPVPATRELVPWTPAAGKPVEAPSWMEPAPSSPVASRLAVPLKLPSRLRGGPELESEELQNPKLGEGEVVTVLDCRGIWVQVESKCGTTGWLLAAYLQGDIASLFPNAKTSTRTAPAADAQQVPQDLQLAVAPEPVAPLVQEECEQWLPLPPEPSAHLRTGRPQDALWTPHPEDLGARQAVSLTPPVPPPVSLRLYPGTQAQPSRPEPAYPPPGLQSLPTAPPISQSWASAARPEPAYPPPNRVNPVVQPPVQSPVPRGAASRPEPPYPPPNRKQPVAAAPAGQKNPHAGSPVGVLCLVTFGLENCDDILAEQCHQYGGGGGATVRVNDEDLLAALQRSGVPNADVIIDARQFPQQEEKPLTKHTGNHPEVIKQLVHHRNFDKWLPWVKRKFTKSMIDWFQQEDKQHGADRRQFIVVMYCKSGQHRSVAASEILRHIFLETGWACLKTRHLALVHNGSWSEACWDSGQRPPDCQEALSLALKLWQSE